MFASRLILMFNTQSAVSHIMVKLSVRKVCSGYQGESLCPESTVHRIYSIDIKANEVAIGG